MTKLAKAAWPKEDDLTPCEHGVPWNTCESCMTESKVAPGQQAKRRLAAGKAIHKISDEPTPTSPTNEFDTK